MHDPTSLPPSPVVPQPVYPTAHAPQPFPFAPPEQWPERPSEQWPERPSEQWPGRPSGPAVQQWPEQAAEQEPLRRRGLTWKGAFVICAGTVSVLLVLFVGSVLQSRWEVQDRRDAMSTYPDSRSSEDAAELASIDAGRAKQARITKVISDALADQSTALLTGDRAAFVGLVAPKDTSGRAWLSRSFASLRAMGVAQWTPKVGHVSSTSKGRLTSFIDISYCFVAKCATPSTITLHTKWDLKDESRPRMTELREFTSGHAAPPWSQSKLRAEIGSRVVVAGSAANAGRLRSVLAKAEAAARVADRYAHTTKPSKYVVYLATAKQWRTWPYLEVGDWAAGYALPERESVVLQASSATPSFLPELLRHELGHVSTLAGQSDDVTDEEAWWLMEGMADYVAAEGRPFAQYDGRKRTVSFVRHQWNGGLRVQAPADKASLVEATGRYGTAFLAVSCLMQKFDRAKALDFFRAVAVTGTSVTTAATEQLGVSWPSLSKSCEAQIRRTAR